MRLSRFKQKLAGECCWLTPLPQASCAAGELICRRAGRGASSGPEKLRMVLTVLTLGIMLQEKAKEVEAPACGRAAARACGVMYEQSKRRFERCRMTPVRPP